MCDQRVEAVELRLRPQEVVESRPRSPARRDRLEVEEIRFQQFLRRIERRPDAEVGRALQHLARRQQRPRHRIDAVARAQIVVDLEVGGGVVRSSARACRRCSPSRGSRRAASAAARRRAGRRRAAPRGCGWRRRRFPSGPHPPPAPPPAMQPELRAKGAAQIAVPFAPLPKVKSSPVTTPRAERSTRMSLRTPPPWSRPDRRRSGTPASRRARGGDTVPRAGRGGQPERRHIGLEEAHRVRIERRDDRGAALRLAQRTASPTTAWWPEWKPSKLPSAMTAPRRPSGMGLAASSQRIRSRLHAEGEERKGRARA